MRLVPDQDRLLNHTAVRDALPSTADPAVPFRKAALLWLRNSQSEQAGGSALHASVAQEGPDDFGPLLEVPNCSDYHGVIAALAHRSLKQESVYQFA
jgi:hypothetical protein